MSPIDLVSLYPAVFDIDGNLNRLVRRIELLSYVNPLNTAQEKKQFFNTKYNYEPIFKYRKVKFDGYKLHRLFFSQRLERIENDDIRKLFEDIIYNYSGLIECIETIGKGKKFYYNSLKSFGTPTEQDIDNAKFILRLNDDEFNQDMLPMYTAEEAKAYFREYAERYDFDFDIKLSNNISAAAMVINNTQTLVLRKNNKFSKNQLKVLANHEIGVHLVTSFNGLEQPLKIFVNGIPNNVVTQEGLAVYAEYMSDCLTLTRLKELSYRVLAVDSLAKGYSFSATFDLLFNQYKLNREKAFVITQRVHRGGGFTKDHVYLSGLKKVYNYTKQNNDLDILLTGKMSLEYVAIVKKMRELGLVLKNPFTTDSYLKNDNTNKNLDFILSCLK